MIKANIKKFGGLKLYKHKPTVIAEAGVNHDCELSKAFKLINDAKNCGVDAIKFQTYKSENLVIKNSPAYWDLRKERTKTQRKLFDKYDKFGFREYSKIIKECKKKKITFLTTLFDIQSIPLYTKYLPLFKIASADITNVPLLKAIASQKKPILLSTGASEIDEIKFALKTLNLAKEQICIMHCVLNYPTKNENANLMFIEVLKRKFNGHLIGYSDHVSPDDNLTSLEVAWNLGAQIIEKHFTYNKNKKGNDHYHSADKNDFIKFYERINKIRMLKGDGFKNLVNEKNSIMYARRSIVSREDIKKGDFLSSKNLTTKRPGTHISAKNWEKVIGKRAKRNIKADIPISNSDIL
jgi:sialic acid synthase SpsE